MKGTKRVKVLGVPVDTGDVSSAIEHVHTLIQNHEKGHYILAVNAEKVIALQKDPFLGSMFDNAALLLPDGIGVVLAIRWLYGVRTARIPGADFMQAICREASYKGYKIFIYGGEEEVNRKAIEKLRITYPGIRIVGFSTGYLDDNGMDALISKINESKADILFVGLGSPKQERWVQKYLPKLNSIMVCQGIGGTLDVISGKTRRAPVYVQKIGFEWLYRLIKDPKRIRRQLSYPAFAFKVVKARKNNNPSP